MSKIFSLPARTAISSHRYPIHFEIEYRLSSQMLNESVRAQNKIKNREIVRRWARAEIIRNIRFFLMQVIETSINRKFPFPITFRNERAFPPLRKHKIFWSTAFHTNTHILFNKLKIPSVKGHEGRQTTHTHTCSHRQTALQISLNYFENSVLWMQKVFKIKL
jgi:hypothetical protein